MKVAVLQCECGYEDEIVDVLSKLGHEVDLLAKSDVLRSFRQSFSTLQADSNEIDLQGSTRSAYDSFVVNSRDNDTAHKLLDYALSQFPGAIRGPKVIMITSLLSWSGKRYHVPIGTSSSEFTSRVPSARETEVYRIENKFHSCSSVTGMPMTLVGVGLVYGGHGFDFHNLFQTLWDCNPIADNVVFSSSDGKNYIPTIHFHDLAQIVAHVAISSASSLFVPASDFSGSTLNGILSALAAATKRKVRPCTKEEALEIVLNSKEDEQCACPHRQWDMDLRFADSHRPKITLRFPVGIVDFTSDVWKEFVSACTNKPCSVLIAGPPSSMKTTLAKALADKLGIAYVDRMTCLKYVVSAAAQSATQSAAAASVTGSASQEAEAATDFSQTLDVTAMDPNQALFVELRRAIAVQMASGDKKKKGVDESSLDLAAMEFSDALIDALPVELLRLCAKNLLVEDPRCIRLGYVLDMWTTISELDNIFEITNTKPERSDPCVMHQLSRADSSVGEDDSQLSGSVIQNTLTAAGPEPTMEQLPRLIVELKCTKEATLDRLFASFGLEAGSAKIPKDQQAAVKELEARLEAYSALLIDVPKTSPEESLSAEKGGEPIGADERKGNEADVQDKSHPVIVNLESFGYNISRVDVSGYRGRNEDGSAAADEVKSESLKNVISDLLDTYCRSNGSLEWLLELKARDGDAAENIDPTETKEFATDGIGEETELGATADATTVESPSAEATLVVSDDGEMVALVNTVDEINYKIANIKPDAKEKLVKKVDAMQDYLMNNVLPHVAEALIKIHRERVDDPVYFMADFLQQRGTVVQEKETADVLSKYLEALAHAEAMEEAAAAELLAIANSSCNA